MSEQYYLLSKSNNQSVGPMSETEVRQWVSQKLVTTDDLIAKVGDNNWISISQSSFAPLANTTGSYPSANREQGRPQEYLQNFQNNFSNARPSDGSTLLIRWVALVIDTLIALPLFFMAVFPFISIIGTPLLVAYFLSRDILMGNGQSIGKRIMGLKVEKADGAPVEWVDSFKRNVVYLGLLSLIFFTIPLYGWFVGILLLVPFNIVLLIDLICAAATGKRLGDNLGNTYVRRAE